MNTTASAPNKLREQCDYYIRLFGISQADLIERSYSDFFSKENNND